MKLFIDTANIDEIREINAWGVLSGVTTNPSLIAKNGGIVKDVIKEICELVDGPISAEVNAEDSIGMIKEARELVKLHKNIIIKIPITEEGLKALKILSEEGIKTNLTLIFSESQALLAAKGGATYVSPFIGRLDDIGEDGLKLVKNIKKIFALHNIETEIIAASVRNVSHVRGAALAGSDIATIPYKIFKEMIRNDLTIKGLEKFKEDFNRVYKKEIE